MLAQPPMACYLHFAWLSSFKSTRCCLSIVLLAAAAGQSPAGAVRACGEGAHSCRCLGVMGRCYHVAPAVPPVRRLAVCASRGSSPHSLPDVQANDWCRQLQHSQQQTLAVAGRDPLMQSRDAAAFDSEAGSSPTRPRPPRAAASRRCARPAPLAGTGSPYMYERM